MEFLIVPIAMLFFVIGTYIGGSKGYKDGQIDAMNGKQGYVLIEFEDGSREYYDKDDISKLKEPYKVIK